MTEHTPYTWLMALLDCVGSMPRGRSPRQCPGHRDAAPSLSLHEWRTESGSSVKLYCHAGCSWRDVLVSMACRGGVLHQAPPVPPAQWAAEFCRHLDFPELETSGGHPGANGYRLEAVHDYGSYLLERWRHPVTKAKDLRWHTKVTDHDGQYTMPGLYGVGMHELPMYNEAEVRAALLMDEPVLLVESESSADALKGWVATTWAGGANAVPMQTVARVLGEGSGVLLVPDVDMAGLTCAQGLRAGMSKARILLGRIGEDARDLYVRLGAQGFRRAVMEAMGDGDEDNG